MTTKTITAVATGMKETAVAPLDKKTNSLSAKRANATNWQLCVNTAAAKTSATASSASATAAGKGQPVVWTRTIAVQAHVQISERAKTLGETSLHAPAPKGGAGNYARSQHPGKF